MGLIPYFYTLGVTTLGAVMVGLQSYTIGRVRSEMWIASSAMSFTIGIMVRPPLKIILTAIFWHVVKQLRLRLKGKVAAKALAKGKVESWGCSLYSISRLNAVL